MGLDGVSFGGDRSGDTQPDQCASAAISVALRLFSNNASSIAGPEVPNTSDRTYLDIVPIHAAANLPTTGCRSDRSSCRLGLAQK